MRIIVHIDLNAFFAQVEMNRHPEYANKPLVVGGPFGRSVVSTANYAARKYGIHSGMPVSEAFKLCKHLIDVPGDYQEYSRQSEFFFRVVRSTFPIQEMASIDECYVDATEQLKDFNEEQIHDALWDFQMNLLKVTKLKCSIGVAPNKFLAKMGSDYKKPLGLTLFLDEKEWKEKLWALPISHMFGVGKKTAPRLELLGINTIGDLAQTGSKEVKDVLGSYFDWLVLEANGGGTDQLDLSEFDPKSTSSDSTFEFDTTDYEEIRSSLIQNCKSVGKHLRNHNKVTRTIAIKLRDSTFNTRSKRMTIDQWTDSDEIICFWALKIFDGFYHDEPLRLVGCSAEGCVDKDSVKERNEMNRQMTIDEALYKKEKDK